MMVGLAAQYLLAVYTPLVGLDDEELLLRDVQAVGLQLLAAFVGKAGDDFFHLGWRDLLESAMLALSVSVAFPLCMEAAVSP